MKRFTCTEEKLLHGELCLYEGDSVTLDDDVVEYFCSQGWGTAEGVGAGERTPGAQAVQPKSVSS